MTLDFTKMNGAGNDFVLLDDRAEQLELTPQQIVRLCHRQRGVGADGLLLLRPNRSGRADWSWVFFNSDASAADMCGNGARCFARFARRVAGGQGDLSFETGAGVIHASFAGDRVTVTLTTPGPAALNQDVRLNAGPFVLHSINTGVPHAVLFVENADRAMVGPMGAEIRYHSHFAPRGTNANFVQVLGPGLIRVRTYERGVEGETLACGTGVTASALVTALLRGFPSPIQVQVQGGDLLEVAYRKTDAGFADVRLSGPAEFVYTGTITL